MARVINDQAFKAGLIGALTGIGGILTLPIAIPVDFALSAKIQAATIHFIAQTYAPSQPVDTLRLQTLRDPGRPAVQPAVGGGLQPRSAGGRRQLIRRLVAETVAESC